MTDAEGLAAAAADECRRILEEKDRLLTAARDERDAARDALRRAVEWAVEMRGYCEAWEWKYGESWDEEHAAARAALAAPVPPGETTPAPCVCGHPEGEHTAAGDRVCWHEHPSYGRCDCNRFTRRPFPPRACGGCGAAPAAHPETCPECGVSYDLPNDDCIRHPVTPNPVTR